MQPTHASLQSVRVWNMLTDGQGGVNWSGLEVACALFGVDNIEQVLHNLCTIKTHKKAE